MIVRIHFRAVKQGGCSAVHSGSEVKSPYRFVKSPSFVLESAAILHSRKSMN